MQRCRICGEKFESKSDLFDHYEEEHNSQLNEKNMSGAQMHFFIGHGRITGKCRVCGKETSWNSSSNLPCVLCGSKECDKKYRAIFVNRMKKVYGKEHLLNDPEVQKKMLANRSISGTYTWSDGTKKQYVGSYELDFLRFLDKLYKFPSNDVLTPAPQIFNYTYEGKVHFYIVDMYIPSLNLLIEIKDGGSNPNTHPKIMAVDKVKEKLKDEAVEKSSYNYIKITDKKYGKFVDFLLNYNDDNFKDKPLKESVNIEIPEMLSEDIIRKMINKLEYNYLIVSDDPIVYDYKTERALNKFAFINKDANTDTINIINYDDEANRFFIYNIDEAPNANVQIFSLKKNGKELMPHIDSDAKSDTDVIKSVLMSYYDDNNDYVDLYKYIYSNDNINDCFKGELKTFASRLQKIDNSLLEESHNISKNIIVNEHLNRGEVEEVKEDNKEKEKKNEIIKRIKPNIKNNYYKNIILNAYKIGQIDIIKVLILEDGDIDNDNKLDLLNLSELRKKEIDKINKDDFQITILPIKLENELGSTVINNIDKENGNIFKEYKNLIQEGEFLDESLLAGVHYLQKRRKLSEEIKNSNNNIIKSYILGIGDM